MKGTTTHMFACFRKTRYHSNASFSINSLHVQSTIASFESYLLSWIYFFLFISTALPLFRPSASFTHFTATASDSVACFLHRNKCRHRIIYIMSLPCLKNSLCPKIEVKTPQHGLRFPLWYCSSCLHWLYLYALPP